MRWFGRFSMTLTCSVLGGTVACSGTCSDPSLVIENEWTMEISQAAGSVLVHDFEDTYSPPELIDLAITGKTPGIRLAAERALHALSGGLAPWVGFEDDFLLAQIAKEDRDAADAFVFKRRSQLRTQEALIEAIGGTESEVLQAAYGRLLGGYYGPGSPTGQKSEAELRVLVERGETHGERIAAATALSTYWILYDVADNPASSIARVCSDIWAISGAPESRELGQAYQTFLTYLYSL